MKCWELPSGCTTCGLWSGTQLHRVSLLSLKTYYYELDNKHYSLNLMPFLFLYGPKRDGVREGWRKLHKEKLHNLYSSPNIIRIIKSRRMRRAGHVARMGEKRNMCRLLVGKPEGKRPLGRLRHRWIDNIKMDLLEIGLADVDWIGLAQDRCKWRALVKVVMHLWVP
jgi:hypothetical protein